MPIDAAPPGAGSPFQSRRLASDRGRLKRRLMVAGAVAAGLAVVIVVAGVLGRAHDAHKVEAWTTSVAIPAVTVVSPSPDTGAGKLTLPGTLQAYFNAPIYSRVSGYVRAWYVDIGAQVKAGQLLATIDTPELDQQLIQARADLASAQADMNLAQTTAQRWARLLTQDAVSKQEADEKAGDFAVKTARVNAAKANVERLLALKSFSRITAPFAGVVTARRTDIGALVNAGAGATPNSELFDVAKVDELRLYVRVPQNELAHIQPGLNASLTVPEYPGRSFQAKLATTSRAVSDNSGTLLAELSVDNSDRLLTAGEYAQVSFDLPGSGATGGGAMQLPSSAFLFRSHGMEVATVGPDNRVRLKPVRVGRNLGGAMEVKGGVAAGDRVIDNPPDSIADGELVRVLPTAARTQGGGADAGG
jgi:RND family efflux transporter MFP subunit